MKTNLSILAIAVLSATAHAVSPQDAGINGIVPWGTSAPPVALPVGKIPAPGDKGPDIKIKPATGSAGSNTVADVPKTEGTYSGPAAPAPAESAEAPCVKKPNDLLPCDVAKTVGSGLKLFQSGMGLYSLYKQYKGAKDLGNLQSPTLEPLPEAPAFANATTPEEARAQALALQQQAAARQQATASGKAAMFAENPANSANNSAKTEAGQNGQTSQVTATAGTLPNGQANPVVAAIAAQNAADKAKYGHGGFALAARDGVFSRSPGAKPDYLFVDGKLVPIADVGRASPVLPAVARVKW